LTSEIFITDLYIVQKPAQMWSQFMAPVPAVCVMGINLWMRACVWVCLQTCSLVACRSFSMSSLSSKCASLYSSL